MTLTNNKFSLTVIFIIFVACFLLLMNVMPKPEFKTTENIALQSYGELTLDQIRIINMVSNHAYKNHGENVDKALNCLNKNGSTRAFKSLKFIDSDGKILPTNTWLCLDGKDWYIIITTIFEKIGGDKVARLVNAFELDTKIYPTIESYIQRLYTYWEAKDIDIVIKSGVKVFIKY
jgi:hypothetical protein